MGSPSVMSRESGVECREPECREPEERVASQWRKPEAPLRLPTPDLRLPTVRFKDGDPSHPSGTTKGTKHTKIEGFLVKPDERSAVVSSRSGCSLDESATALLLFRVFRIFRIFRVFRVFRGENQSADPELRFSSHWFSGRKVLPQFTQCVAVPFARNDESQRLPSGSRLPTSDSRLTKSPAGPVWLRG